MFHSVVAASPFDFEANSGVSKPRGGLLSRVAKVRSFFKKEAGWIAGSVAVGMGASALFAGVAGVAGTIAVGSVLNTAIRHVRKNVEAEREALLKEGKEAPSTLRLLFKHAAQEDIGAYLKSKEYWKKVATSAAISGATAGLLHGFFTEAHAAVSDPASSVSHSVSQHSQPALPDCSSPTVACGEVDVVPVAPVDVVEQAKAILGHDLSTPQQIKDAALSLLKTDDSLAVDLFHKAAEAGNIQAKIDLAYLQFHGLHGVDADPEAALSAMKEIAAHSKGTAHDVAKEFVNQWTGTHPTEIPPVEMVEARHLAEASQKAAEAAQAAAEKAAEVATPTSLPDVPVAPQVQDAGRVVLECQLNVPEMIAPETVNLDVAPTCIQYADEVRPGDSIRLDGETFTKSFNSVATKTMDWAKDKMAWLVGRKVGDAIEAYRSFSVR